MLKSNQTKYQDTFLDLTRRLEQEEPPGNARENCKSDWGCHARSWRITYDTVDDVTRDIGPIQNSVLRHYIVL